MVLKLLEFPSVRFISTSATSLDAQVCRFVQELVRGAEHNRFLPAAQQILSWMKKNLLHMQLVVITQPDCKNQVNGSLIVRHELCAACKN